MTTELRIVSLSVSNGLATITWDSTPNQTYRLQYKTNVNDSIWQEVLPDVTAAELRTSTTDPVGNVSQRFYRVMQVQAPAPGL